MLFLSREEGQGLVEYGLILNFGCYCGCGHFDIARVPKLGNVYSRVVVCVPPTPNVQWLILQFNIKDFADFADFEIALKQNLRNRCNL